MSRGVDAFWYNARTVALISAAFATMGATIALTYLSWWLALSTVLWLWLVWAIGVGCGLMLAIRLHHLRSRASPASIAQPKLVTDAQPVQRVSDSLPTPPRHVLRSAIAELTEKAISLEGFCVYCQASAQDLLDRPYDPSLHAEDCPIPIAHKLVQLEAQATHKQN
jgi:hypothetical protein